MELTKETPYTELQPHEQYLTDESRQAIHDKAVAVYGNYEDITLEQLSRYMNGDFGKLVDEKNPTVLQVYWLNGLKDFIQKLPDVLKAFSVPETPEEAQAGAGLPSVTFMEGMLVFARSYFGHTSFEAASRTTIGDIIIAKKDRYRQDMMQMRLAAIQRRKMNAKK